MLTKRTNILFDERLFEYLVFLAKKNKTSVGNLVRKAVSKAYLESEEKQGKIGVYQKILRLKKGLGRTRASEIKSLITYGRKY